MARQIVVSGGAGYWCGPEGLKLDEFVLSLTGKARPRVCAITTASGDFPAHIESFYDILGPLCEPSHLSLFRPPLDPPEHVLSGQDVIYVGGGSTPNMLAVWRVHGIDAMLRSALNSGTILYGSSAGGSCWLEAGLTDSLGFDGMLRPLTNGLGLLPGSHSPHFDRPGRVDAYSAMAGVPQQRSGCLRGTEVLAARNRRYATVVIQSTIAQQHRQPGGSLRRVGVRPYFRDTRTRDSCSKGAQQRYRAVCD